MSHLVIRQSSCLEETNTGDDDLSDWQKDNMDYAKLMIKSSDKVENRLNNLYKVRKAHQMGYSLGHA